MSMTQNPNDNDTKKIQYLIVGAGGCGASIGAFLVRSGKLVQFIARGEHLVCLRKNGLSMETTRMGNFTVNPLDVYDEARYLHRLDQGTIRKPDVIFVCVKYYSLKSIVPFLRDISDSSTIIIPILNIYGTGQQLQKEIPQSLVTDGCMYIAAEIKAPGCIVQKGDIFKIVYGMPFGDNKNKTLVQIQEDLSESGIEGILSDDIRRDAMIKFSLISPMAACGAYYNVRVGKMQQDGPQRRMFTDLVKEIGILGKAMEIELPENLIEINLKLIDDLLPDACASMQRDLWKGKESEVDGIVFEVLRMAQRANVKLPVYENVAQKLRYELNQSTI